MKPGLLMSVLVLAGLAGCGPTYSPDTYASNAAQQANKVEQGLVIGVRTVAVSASGTVGTVTGAAAGGIAGSQVGVGPISAFTALGGSLAGGLGGSAVEHMTADTVAYEYIVRKPNGDLISVTQKDKTPLALGQKVLVIAGTQARIVPDYTVPPSVLQAKTGEPAKPDTTPKPPKPPETPPTDASRTDQPASDAHPAGVTPGDAGPTATKTGAAAAPVATPGAAPVSTPGPAPATDAPAPAATPSTAGTATPSPAATATPAAGSAATPAGTAMPTPEATATPTPAAATTPATAAPGPAGNASGSPPASPYTPIYLHPVPQTPVDAGPGPQPAKSPTP